MRTAQGHPHCTQYFAARLWDVAWEGRLEPEVLRQAWRERVVGASWRFMPFRAVWGILLGGALKCLSIGRERTGGQMAR